VRQSPTGNDLRVTIPIEITVRAGSQEPARLEIAAGAPAAAKTLSRGAEAIKIDQDYANRPGYKPNFIPGIELNLPALNAALTKQLAPLRAEETNAADGELKYEHFSIKMDKSKRMAIFTATNIDGPTYLNVDRDTGLVKESEGETWFKDPRISASFFLDQTFYSAWSTYFDRGHLTRRTDPTWGTDEEAERANADTFHFTNCSPQHFRFNQSAKYWQGAERYVLENGVLAADSLKRICVFQGPLFDSKIDLWSDHVQIPSSFFKVIAWKGAHGLKSVGLVVDQLPLLSETRKNLGTPQDLPSVNVSQWRVAIPTIEKRSGLDFGQAIRDADTIGGGQPLVGGEAAKLLRSFEDILG
jgi:endonuclease G